MGEKIRSGERAKEVERILRSIKQLRYKLAVTQQIFNEIRENDQKPFEVLGKETVTVIKKIREIAKIDDFAKDDLNRLDSKLVREYATTLENIVTALEDVNVIFLEIFPEISKGRQIDSGIKDAFVAEKGVSEEEVATAVERTQHLLQIVSSILYISIVLSGLEYPVGKMLYLVSSAIYLFLFLEDGQRKISKPIARHLVPVINTLNFYKKRKDFEKNFSSREKNTEQGLS